MLIVLPHENNMKKFKNKENSNFISFDTMIRYDKIKIIANENITFEKYNHSSVLRVQYNLKK